MTRIVALLCAFVLLLGCQPGNHAPSEQSTSPNKKIPETIRVKQTNPDTPRRQSGQEKAQHLAQIATNHPEVKKATAITAGNYTLVGIDVRPSLKRGEVGTIKYSVAETLKKDPTGANALVTADVDLVARIRELAADIENGRPLGGLSEELAEIAARIMPQPSKEVKERKHQKEHQQRNQ